MKICKICNIEKSLDQFGPHSTAGDGYNPKCRVCVSAYNKQYRTENKNHIQELNKQFYESCRETVKERSRLWRDQNPEQKQRNDKRRYRENKELYSKQAKARHQKNGEANCQRAKKWREDNPARVAANIAKRRAAKKQAIPKWADMSAIRKFYEEAQRITERTGIPHQVDHIYPLSSKVMCGLHVENNLQVITAEKNNAKKNKIID